MVDILPDESMSDYWRDMKIGFKLAKEENLQAFNPAGWRKHTDYHFSQIINDNRIDYYPSTRVIILNDKRQRTRDVNKVLSRLKG